MQTRNLFHQFFAFRREVYLHLTLVSGPPMPIYQTQFFSTRGKQHIAVLDECPQSSKQFSDTNSPYRPQADGLPTRTVNV